MRIVHWILFAGFAGLMSAACGGGSDEPSSLWNLGGKGEEGTTPQVDCSAQPGPLLADAIAVVNAQVKAGLLPLTEEIFHQWWDRTAPYLFSKRRRRTFEAALSCGRLPSATGTPGVPSSTLLVSDLNGVPEIRYGLDAGEQFTIIQGMHPYSYLDKAALSCNYTLCDEPFDSSTGVGQPFPTNVQLRVEERPANGRCSSNSDCDPRTLEVTFELTAQNIDALSSYFSVGFGMARIRAALAKRLNDSGARPIWISLNEIFPNWLGTKANTYPRTLVDNDVCFGVARQFFHPTLENAGEYERSTEPLTSMLNDHYRLLDDSEQPTFGDILYLPLMHASRFVMTDPNSRRWIGFSVTAGGYAPYRFWWIDQDYGVGGPDPEIRQKVDIWRRR